jgi:hypothetical protein
VKGVLIRQRLAELDTQGIWKYPLPEMTASEDEIAATELKLGYRLDHSPRLLDRLAGPWLLSFQARFSPVSAPDVVIPYAGVA